VQDKKSFIALTPELVKRVLGLIYQGPTQVFARLVKKFKKKSLFSFFAKIGCSGRHNTQNSDT
jgi:hypothetical protein